MSWPYSMLPGPEITPCETRVTARQPPPVRTSAKPSVPCAPIRHLRHQYSTSGTSGAPAPHSITPPPHPRGLRVVVVPADVLDEVRHHVHHPSRSVAVDRLNPPDGPAGDDLLHFSIMLAVAVLVADYGLDPCFAEQAGYFQGFVGGGSHRFFVGDELHARLHPRPDKGEPDMGRRAEGEDVGTGPGEHVGDFRARVCVREFLPGGVKPLGAGVAKPD